MKNQVDALRGVSDSEGVAHVLNSSLTKGEVRRVMEDITQGVTKLLYVAPESLTKGEYVDFLLPMLPAERDVFWWMASLIPPGCCG